MPSLHRFGLGWLPDRPDHRDKTFARAWANSQNPPPDNKAHTFNAWENTARVAGERFASQPPPAYIDSARPVGALVNPVLNAPPPAEALPRGVDLRAYMSPVESQGRLNSCTANAVMGLVEYLQIVTRHEYVDGSRLFLYKTTREYAGQYEDAGSYIRDAIKAMRLFGICPERHWPYDEAAVNNEPRTFCYAYAGNYRPMSYYRLETLTEIKRSLAQGYPVVLGFTCFESLFLDSTAASGIIPYPNRQERMVGGHAILAVGYMDGALKDSPTEREGHLIIRNSWGSGWGAGGYGLLPYSYLPGNGSAATPLADDFWTMSQFETIDVGESQAAPFLLSPPVPRSRPAPGRESPSAPTGSGGGGWPVWP